MKLELVDQIARAVLYEGYILYPYRPSSIKNQQRWNFGVLYPPAWAAQTGQDRAALQMEFLAEGSETSRLELLVRFLQLRVRGESGGQWEEGVERSVGVDDLAMAEILCGPRTVPFRFPASVEERQQELAGRIEVEAAPVDEGVFRITVRVANTTAALTTSREETLLHSLASAHAVLQIRDGKFFSQTDPPDYLREASAACENKGVWPILIGEEGSRNMILGSPIILADYPKIAPESAGDLFDGTEIDEILTLRILTLTDDEKAEIRGSDERARQVLEMAETLPAEHLMRLHGVIREIQPAGAEAPWSPWDTETQTHLQQPYLETVCVRGVDLKKGDRVRLRPNRRADILDTVFDGKIAIIEALEKDFEDKIHLAVVLEDDPGRDLGEMRQAGHRFFFSAEEIEPIQAP